MRHVVQISGGISSAETLMRVVAMHGTTDVTGVFCDTLVEDSDLYRFLIESTTFAFGGSVRAVADLAERARILPPVKEETLPERKILLAALRTEAVARIPQMVWLADGRTPWEVIFDTRFLSNRADKCSEYLKRRLSDRWCRENCDPVDTIRYLGFGWDEQKRIDRSHSRFAKSGWRAEFPMDSAPLLIRITLMQAWLDRSIRPPRAYYEGFPHNNCGRFCMKMGQASAAKLLDRDPDYYAYNERQENRFRGSILADASILKDRRGGGPRKSISLQQFRESIQTGGAFDQCDRGACSCFDEVDDEIEDAA